MTMKRCLVHAFALGLLAVTVAPAAALDLDIAGINISVGEDDGGGVSASVSAGGQSVGASVGGGGVASASVSAGSFGSAGVSSGWGGNLGAASVTSGGVNIGVSTSGGQFATFDHTTDSVFAGLNLGVDGLINGVALSPSVDDPEFRTYNGLGIWRGPGAAPGPQDVVRLFAGFAPGEQQMLVSRCLLILGSPARYEPSLVDLCLILAQFGSPLAVR
jgi:hypothetical protein